MLPKQRHLGVSVIISGYASAPPLIPTESGNSTKAAPKQGFLARRGLYLCFLQGKVRDAGSYRRACSQRLRLHLLSGDFFSSTAPIHQLPLDMTRKLCYTVEKEAYLCTF